MLYGPGGDLRGCQRRPEGTFILTLDSPASHFIIELGTKRNAAQLSFVLWSSGFRLLQRARWQPCSAFAILSHHVFCFGHRTSWIRFEPSPTRNSGRHHPPRSGYPGNVTRKCSVTDQGRGREQSQVCAWFVVLSCAPLVLAESRGNGKRRG